jgi:hypothetical protein
MKKNFIYKFLLMSSISLSACAQTDNWYGTYKYEALLGENVAKDKIAIEYTFILDDEKCQVVSQGYQTDEKILCVTQESGNDLTVKFRSYQDGSTENIYGVEVYPVNSMLFKLTRTDKTLITTWGTLSPDESLPSGEYFAKKN